MKHIKNKGFTIVELLLIFAVVAIVFVLLLPFIKYTREEMEKTVCANNLQRIGLAAYIYARENGGKFPLSIEALYDGKYLADRKVWDCPASKDEGSPENPDYIYTAGLSVKDPSSSELVKDKARNHPNGARQVLFINGAVKWVARSGVDDTAKAD